MLIARKTGHLSLVGSTHDWHNCCSGRKLSLCIPPPIARVVPPEDATILRGREGHRFKIEVRLKWEMWQMELGKFENIPVE
jgi:hypothetical protein